MRKPVLVVDDSRVATAALRRMLEQQGLPVDAAESGEEAIEYLRSNVHPSVIFLDHMMPGMDGFEALSAIRRDMRLALVPVVMYTSQEAENYLGQALARGANDVLHKPPRPVELRRILDRLNLLEPPSAPEPERTPRAAAMPPQVAEPGSAASATAAADNLSKAISTAATLSAPHPTDTPAEPVAEANESVVIHEHRSRPARWVLYAVLALAPVLLYFGYQRHVEQPSGVSEGARLKADRPSSTPPGESRTARATPAPAPKTAPEPGVLLDALGWAVNLQNQYAYYQLPLDDQRLGVVRELVARLAQAEFRGVVQLDTHVGEFCLARDGFGGFKLPETHSRISECEVVKYTEEEAAALGRRQSPAFARYLVTQGSRGNIKVEVVSHGSERPVADYPDYATTQTAGEWNAIAQRNNRVQISIIPQN